MTRKEIVNSPEYKATKAALKWWYSLPEEQRKATDIDTEPDVVDAYTEGVIYGWNNPQWISVKKELPEENGKTRQSIRVWATDGLTTCEMHYNFNTKTWTDMFGDKFDAILWMPLPKAPVLRKED